MHSTNDELQLKMVASHKRLTLFNDYILPTIIHKVLKFN